MKIGRWIGGRVGQPILEVGDWNMDLGARTTDNGIRETVTPLEPRVTDRPPSTTHMQEACGSRKGHEKKIEGTEGIKKKKKHQNTR